MASDDALRDRHARRILRQATFISPSTGERVKRVFSLREASHRLRRSFSSDESRPLLPERRRPPHRKTPWFTSTTKAVREQSVAAWEFASSSTGQGILKCSLAYLIGSLATFVPAISSRIGKQDSKHMVCTVTVWFHPARSIGSMHEATVLALIGFCYAAFISFTSMGVAMGFGQNGLLELGHAIDLIVFLGGGLGFVAWVKQHFGHPLVNVACSLASLGCITTLVKEGSVQIGAFSANKVSQILVMVIMGVIIVTLVNFIVLPVRARSRLRKDLSQNTDLLGEIFLNITRAFLVGEESILEDGKPLAKEHEASLNSMSKNLSEARPELFILGREKEYKIAADLVRCLNRLSQDVGGLRSAASTQFGILSQKIVASNDNNGSPATPATTSSPVRKPVSRRDSISRSNILEAITEAPEDTDAVQDDMPWSNSFDGASTPPNMSPSLLQSKGQSRPSATMAPRPLVAPADMFLTFIDQLGPPAKSLAYTLKQILDELPFDASGKIAATEQFQESLQRAIELYKQSRKEALDNLYKSRALSSTRRTELLADLEEVAASCGHFSFALLDFAEDALAFLDLLEDLKIETESSSRSRSWRWLMFWNKQNVEEPHKTFGVFPEHEDHGEMSRTMSISLTRADGFSDPEKSPRERPWSYALYKKLRLFRRDDVHFAIKVGVGAALYALPAFIPSSRPFFSHWRGEWGLVSYMVVCSMTIGASNTTGINRFIGTAIGALLAVAAWLISNHNGKANPWLLGFFGWLMSLGCFYLILAKNNGPMGRFILLTYNLGALYAYSLSTNDNDNDDDEGGIDPAIWEIVLHRVVSVIVGCIWGIIITRFIWPISARRKLKDGLCVLWLRMSLIWRRDPLAMMLMGEPVSSYMDIREEAELQSFLTYLDSLRKAAASEFELRGPFPDKITARMIDKTRRMLEAFHAMNMVISKDLQATPGEADVLRHTRDERNALSARISHLFSVLASSLKLEYPLNDVLPNIEQRRDRLLAKIFEFRRTSSEAVEQDYELLYAYVLVTGQLARDIEAVAREIETLFGTLNEENLKLE